jgi:hypothetical protein
MIAWGMVFVGMVGYCRRRVETDHLQLSYTVIVDRVVARDAELALDFEIPDPDPVLSFS